MPEEKVAENKASPHDQLNQDDRNDDAEEWHRNRVAEPHISLRRDLTPEADGKQPGEQKSQQRQHKDDQEHVGYFGNEIDQKAAAREEIAFVPHIQIGSDAVGRELKAKGKVAEQVNKEGAKGGERRPFRGDTGYVADHIVCGVRHFYFPVNRNGPQK